MGPQNHVDIIYWTHWFCASEKGICRQGLHPGDCLIPARPLGTGIVNTTIKDGLATPETITKVTRQMAELNKTAITGAVNDKAKETVNII